MITVKEKSAAVESKPKVPRFPRLMKLKRGSLIVLFTSEKRGVIIFSKSNDDIYRIGHEEAGWEIGAFKDCGPIEISNVE